MNNPTQPTATDTTGAEQSGVRPWVGYGLGMAFIILLFVCYVQADVVLGWMESIVHALFLR